MVREEMNQEGINEDEREGEREELSNRRKRGRESMRVMEEEQIKSSQEQHYNSHTCIS